jgi:hypothetical protein
MQMVLAAVLTILIDGSTIETSQPAQIVAGRTMAPLVPIVMRFADAISLTRKRTIVIERGRRSVEIPFVGSPACPECIYVPLAPVVHALGGQARYDPGSRSVELSFGPRPIRTPEPYDMFAIPRPAVTTLSWPTPPTPGAPPLTLGIPQPRRTPVEVRVPGL